MSTRSTAHFKGYGADEPVAIIYRHTDGYPDGAGTDIVKFFEQVEQQCEGTIHGTRFGDPSYLAAKYVVFLSGIFAKYSAMGPAGEDGEIKPLNFGSVGVMDQDPGDIEYRYTVDCDNLDSIGRPTVTVEEIGWNAPDKVLGTLDEAIAAAMH